MKNILLLFGGKSCEHDISIITGLQYAQNSDVYLYNIIPVYIDKNGSWWTGKNLFDLDNYHDDHLGKLHKCLIAPNDKSLYICVHNKYKKYCDIDVAVVCMHGVNGEDGCVSGLMQLSGIPYTVSGVCGSSVCMDKVVFKYFCKGIGVSVVDGFSTCEMECYNDLEKIKKMAGAIGYPVIIKPSRQGSSIGIEIAQSEQELFAKIKNSLKFDKKLLIEKLINVKKEINIALFLSKGEMVYSMCEEPIRSEEILSFKDKYVSTGFQGIKRKIPADIDIEMLSKIKEIASTIYTQLDLFGVVRFDFLLDIDDNLYLNEVNTIPGSMANYLFDKSQYDYKALQDIWLSNAVLRNKKENENNIRFDTDILSSGVNIIKK